MTFLLRSTVLFLLLCLVCFGQSMPPEVAYRIERQVRNSYSVPPTVKLILGPVQPSEFLNYDALTITFDNGDKKQPFDFLLAKDGKTLVRMAKLDLTKDPYAEIMKKIDVSGRPVRGNRNAKVVLVNYDDFQCPFCARMHQNLFPELLKEYGDRVSFIYKDFPLAEIHPWATHAAVNANCLAAQSQDAYWEFADYIHANQKEVNAEKSREGQFAALDRLTLMHGQKRNLDQTRLQACIKTQPADAVEASTHEGSGLGVEVTPTMFVNGERIDGAMPISDIQAVLDRALERAGETPPPHPAAVAAVGSRPSSK